MRSNQLAIRLFTTPRQLQLTTRFSFARLLMMSVMVSFLGSIPPGTTNLLTMRLASSAGLAAASWFSVGCMMAELIYVSASLYMVDRILRFGGMFKFLQWLSVAFLLAFSAACFVAAASHETLQFVPEGNNSSPFVFGFVMMIINPVQFPFWLGWATVLAERKVLKPDGRYYLTYASGAATGSLLASACFVLLGQFILARWSISSALFQTVLGALLLLSAVVQIRKLLEGRSLTIKNRPRRPTLNNMITTHKQQAKSARLVRNISFKQLIKFFRISEGNQKL